MTLNEFFKFFFSFYARLGIELCRLCIYIYALYNARNCKVRKTQKLLAQCNQLSFVQSSSGSALAAVLEKTLLNSPSSEEFNSTSFDY